MEKSQQWSLALKLCPGSSLELQLPRDHAWLWGVTSQGGTRVPAAPGRAANPGITQTSPRGLVQLQRGPLWAASSHPEP